MLLDGSHGQHSAGVHYICQFTHREAFPAFCFVLFCINYEVLVKFLSIFDGDSPLIWGDFITKVFYFLKTVSPQDGSVDKGACSACWVSELDR